MEDSTAIVHTEKGLTFCIRCLKRSRYKKLGEHPCSVHERVNQLEDLGGERQIKDDDLYKL